jgi:hypothetical protein
MCDFAELVVVLVMVRHATSWRRSRMRAVQAVWSDVQPYWRFMICKGSLVAWMCLGRVSAGGLEVCEVYGLMLGAKLRCRVGG